MTRELKKRRSISTDILAKLSSDIPIKHKIVNGDYGFFSECKEVYYPVKGIKIISTCENISYTFQEVDYFLLENKKIARFIREYTPYNTRRVLINTYSRTAFKKILKNKPPVAALNLLEKQLLTS